MHNMCVNLMPAVLISAHFFYPSGKSSYSRSQLQTVKILTNSQLSVELHTGT